MITKNLAKSLETIGFIYFEGSRPEKSHAYALYGGYLVTVYEASGKKTAFFSFRFPESEENDLKKYNMSEIFSADIDEYSITDYTISENGMNVVCNGSVSVFLKLIDRCVSLLAENEIRGTDYCSKCGNKFGSRKPKKVYRGLENHLMCEHCALDTVEEANRLSEEKLKANESVSPVKGILFSTLFSVLGIALYLLLYYVISPAMKDSNFSEVRYIFCTAGFAVAALAYFGYQLFCKKSGFVAYCTVAFNSVVFTAIGQYLGVVFEFIKLNGFDLSMLSNKHFWLIHVRDTIPADLATKFVSNSDIFWKLLVISIMFTVVGSAIFLLSLHDKTNAKPDAVEIETLTIN